VTWLSAGAWDPLHIFTVDKPIRSLADMNGLRVFGVPTAGKFLSKYGLIPVTIPWDNVEVAMQTGEIDGVAWCGFTEAYEVGWADVCKYALTNSVTGAWFGSYFANTASWQKVPPHLQELFRITIDQSHYYRNVWYWGGEAKLRVEGEKMELTALPNEEWAQVLTDSKGFWDEVAASSPRSAKVVEAFKKYADTMEKAGYPFSPVHIHHHPALHPPFRIAAPSAGRSASTAGRTIASSFSIGRSVTIRPQARTRRS
jgi:TRAP-type mannitol/chloroaromatic compound transport system substrate-binding protein